MAKEKTQIVIKAWPQLLKALEHPRMAMLGLNTEDVCRYLIIRGIEVRLYENNPTKRWDM